MSLKQVSHSPDLSRLRADGYDIEVRSGLLLVKQIPYVNSSKEVKRGTLVSKLDLAGDVTVPPQDHVAYFVGDPPCNADGTPLPGLSPNANQQLAHDITLNHQLSRKPTRTGRYADNYEKITTYIAILWGPAHAINPMINPKTFPIVVPAEGESVFKYVDTASTKAGLAVINAKLETHKIAIVGLGGSGSYVLDLVAKTPVGEIHLFDGDAFLNHNAFRCPGAVSLDDLRKKPSKVSYFTQLYANMRHGIVPHDCFIDESTVNQLQGMTFVFLCVDRGTAKRLIVERLEEWGAPFIDVGMGIQIGNESVGGIITVATSTPGKRGHFRNWVALADGIGNNDYSLNVQIADLNALSATLAVIKWKKLCGYYADFHKEHVSRYTINGNTLLNEEKDEA